MKRLHIIIIGVLLAVFLLYSCIDQFNRGTETVLYNPSFSIPIGPLSYSLQEIMPFAALGEPIHDSILVSDSILGPILIYDDSLFFNNPDEGIDTNFTEPINLSYLSNQWEYIHSLMFRVNFANGLPVNVAAQLYFLNAGNYLIDSLYIDGGIWIQTAEVNSDGIVTSPYENTKDVYIDSTRVSRILTATQIRVYLFLETFHENIDTLRVYSYYHFDLQMAVRDELKLPL